jgi:hypothetical protein
MSDRLKLGHAAAWSSGELTQFSLISRLTQPPRRSTLISCVWLEENSAQEASASPESQCSFLP